MIQVYLLTSHRKCRVPTFIWGCCHGKDLEIITCSLTWNWSPVLCSPNKRWKDNNDLMIHLFRCDFLHLSLPIQQIPEWWSGRSKRWIVPSKYWYCSPDTIYIYIWKNYNRDPPPWCIFLCGRSLILFSAWSTLKWQSLHILPTYFLYRVTNSRTIGSRPLSFF